MSTYISLNQYLTYKQAFTSEEKENPLQTFGICTFEALPENQAKSTLG